MPTVCPVCLRPELACICIERTVPWKPDLPEWGTEGFRLVGQRKSAARPDRYYAIYRKHPKAA